MKAIHIKLLRDLMNMRGAVLTIALVVAAGTAAFVTLRGTWLSLVSTRDRYYATERFGDVFVALERAPNAVVGKLENIKGVSRVYARIVGAARVPLDSLDEPAQAQVISLPRHGKPPLNGVVLMSGRMPEADRDDEALLIEMFAQAHGVKPGDTLPVVIEGRERTLRVVGLAMSPEHVLAIPAGSTAPAPGRFAVLWMPRSAVEAAYDLSGAFNNVVLELSQGSRPDPVIRAVDQVLDPYGGLGAYDRVRQISNYFLTQDLAQLKSMATVAPIIFLAVAAFLLNVVLSRLVELDRSQIATLKAVGYKNFEVGMHYFEMTLVIAIMGTLAGLVVGVQGGKVFTALYVSFYRMPALAFQMTQNLAINAVSASFVAGIIGSAIAVRRVVNLPPAEAMRPAAPDNYKSQGLGDMILSLLGPSARMIAREIMRRPSRTLLSAAAISASIAIVVTGQFFTDAMGFLLDFYMQKEQRETLAVNFNGPLSKDAVHALSTIPGVRDVQWRYVTQVRVRSGHRERLVPLVGHPERHDMRPLLDELGNIVEFDQHSVLLNETLAKILDVKPGETFTVQPLTGERKSVKLTMTGTTNELIALWVHMGADALLHTFSESPAATEAYLHVDQDRMVAVQEEITDMPMVASVVRKDLMVAEFRRQTGESMGMFSFILTMFAVVIAVSVVYNNARVALSLRGRELASLRVLGFTRAEISSILIGELAVQVLVGIPFGLVLGKVLVRGMLSANDPEGFRFPPMMNQHTYAFSVLVIVIAALLSAALVRRKLDKLDLIEVLKSRE